MKKQIFIIIFILVSLIIPLHPADRAKGSAAGSSAAGSSAFGTEDPAGLLEPVNPTFLEYVRQRQAGLTWNQSVGGYQTGYVPGPQDLSHIRGIIDPALETMQFPAYFDLREIGSVTTVKNQNNYPGCWAFSAYASLESCRLPEQILDFSEWHLMTSHGFDYTPDEGANSWVTSAYLIRWSGPVIEAFDPYPSGISASDKLSVVNEVNNQYPPAKHVQQIIYLPERTGPMDNAAIKYFLMNEGPVDFAMNWELNNFNETYNTQYTPWDTIQNHRLAIVGWDDDFPASRFSRTPPGNGAFIARNSWGTQWGHYGYCYISYYEPSLEEFTCFNNAEKVVNYDNIYQHDPMGRTSAWGDLDSYGAAIFSAYDTRPLNAVGFYTNDANVQYEITVYKNLVPGSPIGSTVAASQTGSFIYAGYYTVPLDQTVPLVTDETFSVVVRFINSSHNKSVPIEKPIPHHASAARASAGQSYVSLDGATWTDLTQLVPDTDVCIKAYSQFPEADITFRVLRKTLSAWLISRDYADISFTIQDPDQFPPFEVTLERKHSNTTYSPLLRMPREALHNGSFQYIDEFLEEGVRTYYRIVIYDELNNIIGKSEEIVL